MQPPVRVLHYMWSANFGGIEKLVIDLTTAQKKNPELTSAILIGCKKGSFMQNLIDLNIPHSYAGIKSGFDWRPSVLSSIRKQIRNYDIIHIHTFNPLIYIASILEKKKIVYTIHGNFNFGRKVTLSDRITNFLRTWFLRTNTHLITFNSAFTEKIAVSKYHLQKCRKKIIYNGIYLKESSEIVLPDDPEITGRIKGKFIVGTTCRFNGFKRIDRLIRAFSAFASGKDDTVLVLVGDGVVRPELEKLVKDLNLTDKTIFTGFSQNVAGYQKLMDVCVFPSENEPFGLVAVETLSQGKPTILFSDAGGMLEILSGALDQDVVGSIDELSVKIESLYQTRFQPDEKAIQIRKTIASRFNIKNMEQAFFNSYLEL